MSIELYFGLPGCGKTTLLTAHAVRAVRDSRYKAVYSNIDISVPGVTVIDNECIGKFDLSNCLLLIDEATLFADNRAYKEFSKDQIYFFLMHRHFRCDVKLYTQQWDGVDRKIRVITDRVYYVYKGWLLGRWFTRYYRVPYGIIIPDKHSASEKLGEIVQGYCKPNIFIRLFSPWLFRPPLYRYYDSFVHKELPRLPNEYVVNVAPPKKERPLSTWFNKTLILLRWRKQKIHSLS